MNKAVFFDRDGVINHDPGDYTYLLDEFIINDGIIPSLKKLSDNGYLLIGDTNRYDHDIFLIKTDENGNVEGWK